jgi:hypothetical protein
MTWIFLIAHAIRVRREQEREFWRRIVRDAIEREASKREH